MTNIIFKYNLLHLALIVILTAAAGSISAQDLFNAKIYLQGSEKGQLLFNYTNEIGQEGDLEILTHNYRATDGSLFAREELIRKNGELIDHTTEFYPLKEYSRLQKVDEGIEISFRREDKSRNKIIPYRNDIVYGPTQQQYIREKPFQVSGGRIP